MKSLTAIGMAALAMSLSAQTLPPSPTAAPTRRTTREHYDKSAGLVSRVIKEGKSIRFIDMRKEGVALSPLVVSMPQTLNTKIEVVNSNGLDRVCPMKIAKANLADDTVGAAIVIANEGADMPSLTVCPEDRTAVINADRILEDLPTEGGEEVIVKRFTKEMWRSVAFILGGYESQYPCVMKSAFSNAELDANPIMMTCPPVSGNITKNAAKLGFAKVQCVPYFVALRQGWAPAPTNDAQKEELRRFEEIKAKKASATNAPAAK